MSGVTTIGTYEPDEIRGVLSDNFLRLPITVEKGQNLVMGTVIGERPTSEKYVAYDKNAAAEASTPQAKTGGNTGNGTCSEVAVQDAKTLSETVTVTATDATTFAVAGSVSGFCGNATVGSEFKYPNSADYRFKFTLLAGNQVFVSGDEFTFTTTAAGAMSAKGILTENVDATNEDVVNAMYISGNFVESKLTGLDAQAKEDLSGRSVNGLFILP